MRIRRAKKSDIRKIKQITDFPEIQTLKDKDFNFTPLIKYALQSKRYLVLVAEEKGEFIGSSIVVLDNPKPGCAYVIAFGILPRYRNKGYGERLIKTLYKKLKFQKISWVYLWSADNKRTLNFWGKQGFKVGKKCVWCEKEF